MYGLFHQPFPLPTPATSAWLGCGPVGANQPLPLANCCNSFGLALLSVVMHLRRCVGLQPCLCCCSPIAFPFASTSANLARIITGLYLFIMGHAMHGHRQGRNVQPGAVLMV